MMYRSILSCISTLIVSTLLLSGCQKSSQDTWESTKTVGHYLQRKGKMLRHQDPNSKLIYGENEFTGPAEEDFIPLQNEDLKLQYSDISIPQAKETPGLKNSRIPGIEHFQRPSSVLADVFKTLHFETDDHILKNKEDFLIVEKMANYLKTHPHTYIFIEGHCDERASEAYNLALGTRRANAIRNLLIKRGVSQDQIFTISFGKEMPTAQGHDPSSWAKNRRAEFKIYDKTHAH